ncbi:hypothetical protein EVAR_93256_1 [Eumeta japonica]|uniref:Uncharacterized protein n=1 Tax=Eumeta variegata TaxID=151549 RepID=A0A4C1TY36_EUMVA|nr:hypothetical protein EVAR_93256_1 [Eumeta japonica]
MSQTSESERVEKVEECRSNDDRERCGLKEDVVTRVERGVLRLFGYLERINKNRLTNKSIKQTLVTERSARVGLENFMQNEQTKKQSKPTRSHEKNHDEIDGSQ